MQRLSSEDVFLAEVVLQRGIFCAHPVLKFFFGRGNCLSFREKWPQKDLSGFRRNHLILITNNQAIKIAGFWIQNLFQLFNRFIFNQKFTI